MAYGAPVAAVTVRLFGLNDDVAALTAMLHRAYAPLAARGMRYLASHQNEEMTRKRLREGEGYVAVDASGRIVGTVVLVPHDRPTKHDYYGRPHVAWFNQFAVDPDCQGTGIGRQLMEHIEQRALELGAACLALDTSEHAHELIAMYERRGYVIDACTEWVGVTNYRSVIMCKPLAAGGFR